MNRISRIALVALFALVALSFVQAGGKKEGAAEGKAVEEPNLLRIRSVDWLTQKAFIAEAADKFMSEHPGKKVTFESFEGRDVNKYIIQWAGGKSDRSSTCQSWGRSTGSIPTRRCSRRRE
jgi:ABC-type glycerol-3-phosphate transport system substrate-binding protein